MKEEEEEEFETRLEKRVKHSLAPKEEESGLAEQLLLFPLLLSLSLSLPLSLPFFSPVPKFQQTIVQSQPITVAAAAAACIFGLRDKRASASASAAAAAAAAAYTHILYCTVGTHKCKLLVVNCISGPCGNEFVCLI